MPIKDYDDAKTRASDFIKTFYVAGQNGIKEYTYSDQVANISQRRQISLTVKMEHITQHDPELATAVESNTVRYQKIFADVIDDYVKELLADNEPPVLDAQDAFIFQRMYMDRREREQKKEGQPQTDPFQAYPPELMRRFEIYFEIDPLAKALAVRDVRANHVGKLVSMRGVVIRATDVKPSMTVITYTCDTCGNETYQPITGRSFRPVINCPSKECVESKANGRLQQQNRGSKMPKFQELRIQELSDQVPVGSIPRAVTVYARGENTRKAQPGDNIIISGVLTPTVGGGFRQVAGGLITDVVLETHHIYNNRNESEDFVNMELTEEELEIVSQENIYELALLRKFMGHTDVKKSLLLTLVGGVDANDIGMKIRGAINVLLVGDPGVAKSQLLSYVDRLALRSQYTTGRGSSVVGLTAAVVKDSITGEMVLEGGALVLADRGICCIDEFDKMTESDRTSIHEVMEQQTISIAKAGILASLNARVSIIAAANPSFGRYNPKKSIEDNIKLPAALLSRFDLLFLIQDLPDREGDRRLAEHITFVHREGRQPKSDFEPLPMELIRKYIAVCKKKQPKIEISLMDRLIEKYVAMRNEAHENVNSTYTSPRILLGVIRLSTALARLHLSDQVTAEHVDEAIRLMDASKASLNPRILDTRRRKSPEDEAFDVIRDMLVEVEDHSVNRRDLLRRCAYRGVLEEVAERCIDNWLASGVLMQDEQNRVRYALVN
ncbi:DNA replication licensing factor MCM7 [Aphelenchoides bicaudatus]|nr:DNA replication licensing factor MCM7 [Aphelenchoides bicaudatus]